MTSSTTRSMSLGSKNIFTKIAKTASLFILISMMSVSIALAAGPNQPLYGPGGSDYLYSKVIQSTHGFGDLKYYLYEPGGPNKPLTAPLIVFTHGWGGTNPSFSYGAWIEHLVKRGNIVVYPVYQSMISMLISIGYTSNCVKAVLDAIEVLEGEGHVKPDLDRFATVGHSVGGVLAANIAAVALESGLPVPKAVMSVQPGVTPMPPMEDMSNISPDTLLLTVVGDKDLIVGDKDAKRIFNGTSQIPSENKNFIIMNSDRHGLSSLTADHFAPTCLSLLGFMPDLSGLMPGLSGLIPDLSGLIPDLNGLVPSVGMVMSDPGADMSVVADTTVDSNGADSGDVSVAAESMNIPGLESIPMFGTNALDYYGTWKLFDALTDAAFYGQNREYALGNTWEQRYMGEWSDGTPVKELTVLDDPGPDSLIGGIIGDVFGGQ